MTTNLVTKFLLSSCFRVVCVGLWLSTAQQPAEAQSPQAIEAAQYRLSLDSCQQLAAARNKQLMIGRQMVAKAGYEQQAARTNYLPKLQLAGGYMHTGDQMQLLSSSQRGALNNMGSSLAGGLTGRMQQIVAAHPELASLAQSLQGPLGQLQTQGNALGHKITDAFRTDTRNITAAAVLLTQPLYMGGKIRAFDRITRAQQSLAEEQLRGTEHSLRLEVEQAYWQVVSLRHKQRLATSYRDMLAHVDSDVVKMVAEGVATRSDELSVSVKLNEAEMTLAKVDDGLQLSRMLLCKLCGLPLDASVQLVDEQTDDLPVSAEDVRPDVASAWAWRPEMIQLGKAEDIYRDKVQIARSAFLPQVALLGGYMVSNPNVLNGFERKFDGTWAVGVTLKMPLWNWGEGRYKVRAAKAEAAVAKLKKEDAKDLIRLELEQSALRVGEADRQYRLSLKHFEKADENLRTASLGHREGVITTSDLLAAHTAWLQAHSDKIDAQIDCKLSRAVFVKAQGTAP